VGAPGDPSDRDDQPRTLGEVLYADKAKARVQEQDWVRLVQCIAGGDQAALHALFAQSHRIVFTLIVRITSNRETAEEVTLGGHVPLSTTRYCLPLSPDTVAAVVKLAEVAPLISLNVVPASVLNCH